MYFREHAEDAVVEEVALAAFDVMILRDEEIKEERRIIVFFIRLDCFYNESVWSERRANAVDG